MSKQLFIIMLLAAVLAGFFVFTKTMATFEQKEWIARYDIDKLFHLAGGLFLMLLFSALRPEERVLPLVLLTFLTMFSWELFELAADRDVARFFSEKHDLWLRDTLKDIVAGGIGVFVGARVVRRRGRPQAAHIIEG